MFLGPCKGRSGQGSERKGNLQRGLISFLGREVRKTCKEGKKPKGNSGKGGTLMGEGVSQVLFSRGFKEEIGQVERD